MNPTPTNRIWGKEAWRERVERWEVGDYRLVVGGDGDDDEMERE
jgi:hypothetical protein